MLMFASCLEVLHYVSLRNGNAEVSVRYAVLNSSDINEIPELLQPEFILGPATDYFSDVKKTETELEIAYEAGFQGRMASLLRQTENPLFVPVRDGKRYIVTIPGMGFSDEEAIAMLNYKYRMLVDLRGNLSSVSQARFLAEDISASSEADKLLTSTVYGNIMLVEFPMIILGTSEEALNIELF